MYRTSALPEGRGGLVTIRRYLDPLDAQMDRAHLEGGGIRAYVLEAVSFNPLLSGLGGGVQLQVGERDVEHAEAILDAAAPGEDASADDGEGPGAVRCPRCELAYCALERDRLVTNTRHPLAALLAVPLVLFGAKRWHCARCEHVWDDPREGPAEMTRLEPGDPRPVFRLRRAHAGMGLMTGLTAAFFVLIALPDPGRVPLALALLALSWLTGAKVRYEVCSDPRCRAPLRRGAEECPRCKGSVAGAVLTAADHYAQAADVRRELAALRDPSPRKTLAKAVARPRSASRG